MGVSGVAGAAPADPLATEGKALFEAQACSACHGEGGVGTAAGVKLIGIGAKMAPEQLAGILRNPTDKMKDGGMAPLTLKDEEIKAIVAYLGSLK